MPSTEAEHISHHGETEPLLAWDRFHVDQHTEMLDWLETRPGSAVLDAGCGTGGMTALLAQRVGPAGRVEAIDISDPCLAATSEIVESSGCASWTSIRRGDVQRLDFPDAQFDLVWCSRVVHGEPDQLAVVRELRRVLRPGGRLVLREGGQGLSFLPYDIGIGEPGLEWRLQAAQYAFFGRMRSGLPESVRYPGGWLAMLEEAGFGEVVARTFLLERAGPPSPDALAVVISRLNGMHKREHLRQELDESDIATLEMLCDESAPSYIGNRTDLHLTSSSSLYVGVRNGD